MIRSKIPYWQRDEEKCVKTLRLRFSKSSPEKPPLSWLPGEQQDRNISMLNLHREGGNSDTARSEHPVTKINTSVFKPATPLIASTTEAKDGK